MRNKTGYALKRALNLVPFDYNPSSESFRRGAWKNWPARMSDDERLRVARAETPSANGYVRGHRFV